jgi:hypothetical protein
MSDLVFGFASISKLQSSITVVFTMAVLSAARLLIDKPRRQLRFLIAPLLTLLMIAVWITLKKTGYTSRREPAGSGI